MTNWGPSGETVYRRTYARTKPNGELEEWPETVDRVISGNLSLVYGDRAFWTREVCEEYKELSELMLDLKILPAGRHLWASGVKGRQYLMNCWVAGWTATPADHFEFSFLRLMEGGGVGANYSFLDLLPGYNATVSRELDVHIVCDHGHNDFEELEAAGLISTEYSSDWSGSLEVEDSREGWAAALSELVECFYSTYDRHRNRVFDVSNVRPAGARLRTFGGTASGPEPLARMLVGVAQVFNRAARECRPLNGLDAMLIDHEIAKCVVAGGVRRSARMSIMHWADPLVLDFIKAKRETGEHWTTNISVEVDERFFEELGQMGEWAWAVHLAVTESMIENGEPGYWNSTLSNKGEVGRVECTNPCGEIALEPWEPCNLGHVNLEAFAPQARGEVIDYHGMIRAHELMARFLIRATFGDVTDPNSRAILDKNRRIGVGHFGVQGFLNRIGKRYSEAPDLLFFANLLERLKVKVRSASREYAFELRIPEPVKVTTVAPTGTVAKLAGASEGIHPIYARYFLRRIRFSKLRSSEEAQVEEYRARGYLIEDDLYAANTWVVSIPTVDPLAEAVDRLGFDPEFVVESADEISLDRMLAFQRLYQRHYADNAVSFTVNFPAGSLNVNEAAMTLAEFLPFLKGTTLMPDGTRPQAPYERLTRDEFWTLAADGVIFATDSSIDDECATGACPIR